VVTAANCGGVFQGDSTQCEGEICVLGGCCGTDGVCDDGFVASQCVDADDVFSPGTLCADITCEPKGACCDGGNCTLVTEATCAGLYSGDGTLCDSSTCVLGGCCGADGACNDGFVASQCVDAGDVFSPEALCADIVCEPPSCSMADLTGIVFADDTPIAPLALDQPGNCAIDARQPHDINDVNARKGWDRMVMSFSCDPASIGLIPGDFTVSGVPAGVVPDVVDVPTDSVANTATVLLDGKITPAQWTCIAHSDSGGQWCMGYLPADAGQDGVSAATDINKLIDSINLVALLPIYAADINRSDNVVTGADILRLIDLLNGAGDFNPWIAQSLPPCPTP